MREILRRVGLSVLLLIAATATLLLSDLRSRSGARRLEARGPQPVRIAILKHVSSSLLDEAEQGVLQELATEGFRDGDRVSIQRFCAEGDLPTGNTIASRITDGSFYMVISISTLSLQCVAGANKAGRAIHVFGAVTDPAGAGVGIRSMDSTNHPPWMAGVGTFQPVEPIFRLAKQLWPGLKVVGVVWNPTERNSETCTEKAREISRVLGIQLLEATVEASKDVREAAQSLVARGVQAFWTGADVTVNNATAALCEVANQAHIPVFSNTSGQVREGTLFDLGANYMEVGEKIGAIAAAILRGTNAATVVITNYMPEHLMLNRQVLKQMRDPWRFSPSLEARAALIIGPNGKIEKDLIQPAQSKDSTRSRPKRTSSAVTAPQNAPVGSRLTKCWRIQQICYSESAMVEDAMRGLKDGLKAEGLVEGRDFTLKTLNAQGDMATLGSLFDAARTAGVDLYVVYSTPTLQTAIKKVTTTPVTFTVVADPFVIGAGKSDQDHLSNVTGVYTLGAYREMAELLKTYFPHIRRVGTLFCPAEANSVANKDVFVRDAAQCGITVEAVPANTAGDLPDAALALCSRPLDAVVQVIDNLSAVGFPAIAHAAAQAHLPVFACQESAVKQGAVFALSRDYYDAGRETAAKVARILRGESPGNIPFSPPSTVKRWLSLKNAQACGLKIPAALQAESQQVSADHP